MEPTLLVAGGTLAVAGTTLLFGRLDKRREKQKTIEVSVTDSPLWPRSAVDQQQWDQLRVYWGQTEIADPRLINVEFRNVGRIELKESDLSESPAVGVDDGKIVAASAYLVEKGSVVPKAVRGIVRNGDRVEAPKKLLSAGDSLVFRLLVDGGTNPPNYDFRAGGFEVTNRDAQSPVGGRRAFLVRLVAMVTGAVAVLVAALSLLLQH